MAEIFTSRQRKAVEAVRSFTEATEGFIVIPIKKVIIGDDAGVFVRNKGTNGKGVKRAISEEHKEKIRAAVRKYWAGQRKKVLSLSTRRKISMGMKRSWAQRREAV